MCGHDVVEQRMNIFKALAGCYFPPDERLRENVVLLEENIRDQLPELEASVRALRESLPKSLPQPLTEEQNTWAALVKDHARLFLGPFEVLAPPHGSFYFNRDKMVLDQSTEDVARRYQEAGLTAGAELSGLPDHVTAELEFMYFLLFSELAARDREDETEGDTWTAMRRDFFRRHVGDWGPAFAGLVQEHAQEDFYRLLGSVTKAVLTREVHELGRAGPD